MEKTYDLAERTGKFGANVIVLCKKLPQNVISKPLILQVVRSSTSVGANYCEADTAESKRDFKHKIGICKKEAKETNHFLRMLMVAEPKFTSELELLLKESLELTLIFNKIFNSTKIIS